MRPAEAVDEKQAGALRVPIGWAVVMQDDLVTIGQDDTMLLGDPRDIGLAEEGRGKRLQVSAGQ
jgi:hypothetical protein